MAIPLDLERGRFVLPCDLVEVEQLGELTLAIVSKVNAVVRKRGIAGCFLCATPLGQLPLLDSCSACFGRIRECTFSWSQFPKISCELVADLAHRHDRA